MSLSSWASPTVRTWGLAGRQTSEVAIHVFMRLLSVLLYLYSFLRLFFSLCSFFAAVKFFSFVLLLLLLYILIEMVHSMCPFVQEK